MKDETDNKSPRDLWDPNPPHFDKGTVVYFSLLGVMLVMAYFVL